MGLGPVHVARRVCRDVDEFDIIEINEAFAVQILACIHELGLDEKKVNPDGGAGVGSPIAGASGPSAAAKGAGRAVRRRRHGCRGGRGTSLSEKVER